MKRLEMAPIGNNVGMSVLVLLIALCGSEVLAQSSAKDTARLAPVAVTEKAPSVSPRIREFEARRQQWVGGIFLTQAQIEKRHPTKVIDIFRGVTSLKIIDSAGIKLLASSRGLRLSLARGNRRGIPGVIDPEQASDTRGGLVDCVVRIAVDGQLKEWGFDLSLLVPEDLYGIEIFPGASSIPSQYNSMSQRDNGCGLVMLWTKSG